MRRIPDAVNVPWVVTALSLVADAKVHVNMYCNVI